MAVTRHVLKNGMVVLLKEVHTAPIASWWVLYRVGSRNEPTGITGASHWVEHMLFKGTELFPAGTLDKTISRIGANWNAQTFFDYTAYYETLPAEQLDLALRIEADRMVNAAFDPEEVESERTVIISERQGAENSPTFWLGEAVQAAAFRVHGYHHEIIGDMTDLETMTRADLYGHYKRHYVPSNAIAVCVGDFDSAALLARIDELYGSIPAGEAPTLFMRPEPPQQGERRLQVERPGGTAYLTAAYHAPAATDPDWFKLELVNSILCGADSLGGGGIDNKTSRLYRALVESGIAADVDGGLTPTIDPYLYTIDVTARDDSDLDLIERTLDAEIDRLRGGDITQEELNRVKKQARALFAYSTERVTMQAFWLAFAENFHSYTWFENYVANLEAVTLDDVKTTAATYLRPQNRTLGWFIPTDEGDMTDADDFEEQA
jgi:zinc protease